MTTRLQDLPQWKERVACFRCASYCTRFTFGKGTFAEMVHGHMNLEVEVGRQWVNVWFLLAMLNGTVPSDELQDEILRGYHEEQQVHKRQVQDQEQTKG